MAFLKGTAIHHVLSGQKDVETSIQTGMGTIAEKGLPHLQSEVSELQTEIDKRSGKNQIPQPNRVEFGISTNKGPMWETNANIGGVVWSLCDFGDLLPWMPDETTLIDELRGPIVEKNPTFAHTHSCGGWLCVPQIPSKTKLLPQCKIWRPPLGHRCICKAKNVLTQSGNYPRQPR